MARRQRVGQDDTPPPTAVCVTENYESDDSNSVDSKGGVKRSKLRKRGVFVMLLVIIGTFSLLYVTFSNHKMNDVSHDAVSEETVSDDSKSAVASEDTTTVVTAEKEEQEEESVWDQDCVIVEEDGREAYNYDDKVQEKLWEERIAPDYLNVGRCRYYYPIRTPPENDHENGFLGGIDFFFLRKQTEKRERCILECIDRLDKDEINENHLVEAAMMGLTRVAEKLKNKYKLDPLKAADFENMPNFNAIQEAIRGGYAEMVQILSDSNNDLVIDNLGRTVKDYVSMRSSAILPQDAKKYLNLDTASKANKIRRRLEAKGDSAKVVGESGWLYDPELVPSERCDIDVLYDMTQEQFYNDYFMPGRPFVLRGQVPKEEIRAFDKSRWETTDNFHPETEVSVGPSAYPHLTEQEECEEWFTISDIEQNKECKAQPGVPMVHARHPSWDDLDELFPRYDGNIYDDTGGFRFLHKWFGEGVNDDNNESWQIFFGGDDSGATLHWHLAAFNGLYVGMKDWAITPPFHRGWTGMPARDVTKLLDDSITMRCTQLPGDVMYIPNYWGHSTLNRGFAIGAALILPQQWQKAASAVQKSIGAKAIKSEGLVPKADDEKKLFFVHINKAGGTSMIRMLSNRCESQYLQGNYGDGKRSFHASVQQFIEHYGRYEWDSAHSFAVVRHPLARQVSNFFFLVAMCKKNDRPDFCEDRLIPKRMNLKNLSDEEKIEAFHEYTAKLYKKYPPGSEEHYLFGSRGHGNEDYKLFNATQTSWLVDENDKIIVKDIFHLEDLSKDMSKLAEKFPCLKSEPRKVKDSKRSLKEEAGELEMVHVNASPDYPDYRLFGKNKRTNKIIKEVFEVDFRNFGYKL